MHKAKSCAPEGADAPNFLGRSALEGQREGLGAFFLGPLRPMYLCIHIYIYGTPPQKTYLSAHVALGSCAIPNMQVVLRAGVPRTSIGMSVCMCVCLHMAYPFRYRCICSIYIYVCMVSGYLGLQVYRGLLFFLGFKVSRF